MATKEITPVGDLNGGKKKGGVLSKAEKFEKKTTDEIIRSARFRLEQASEDFGHIAKQRSAAMDHIALATPDDIDAAERIRFKSRLQLEQLEGSLRVAMDEVGALKERNFDAK